MISDAFHKDVRLIGCALVIFAALLFVAVTLTATFILAPIKADLDEQTQMMMMRDAQAQPEDYPRSIVFGRALLRNQGGDE